MKGSDFYYCYSKTLKDFLAENEVRYITKAKSIRDDNVFWMYFIDDQLSELLTEYSKLYSK